MLQQTQMHITNTMINAKLGVASHLNTSLRSAASTTLSSRTLAMAFLTPVPVGSLIRYYSHNIMHIINTGKSMRFMMLKRSRI